MDAGPPGGSDFGDERPAPGFGWFAARPGAIAHIPNSCRPSYPYSLTDAKVTGLIAFCDIYGNEPGRHFRVSELAQLDSGDLVLLRDYLGWSTSGWIQAVQTPSGWVTRATEDYSVDLDHVVSHVEAVTRPDDDADPEPHPWEWLATLAAERGLPVTAEQLKEVPYSIYLSARLIEHCT